MTTIRYQGWTVALAFLILLALWQPSCAAVNRFHDEDGTIRINNTGPEKSSSPDGNHGAIPSRSIDPVKSNEPTPSNIFPEPVETPGLASNPNFQKASPESR